MRLRIQCLLIVLLFAAVGALCHQQRDAAQQTTAQFKQAADAHTANALRYFAHSILAPDLVGNVTAESCTKAPVKNFDIPGGSPCPKPVSGVFLARSSADLHPDPAAYYIYSLGRIRI